MLSPKLYLIFLTIIVADRTVSQLTSGDASEGECLSPTSKAEGNINYAWVFYPNTDFFVPMGSQHLYRAYAEYLLGGSAQNQAELNTMNLKIGWIGAVVTTTGFGQNFQQICKPPGKPSTITDPNLVDYQCDATFGSTNTNLQAIDTTHDTLAWTDNESTLLIVRCIHKKKDFKVLSSFSKITGRLKEVLLEKIEELGFSQEKVEYLPYKGNSTENDKCNYKKHDQSNTYERYFSETGIL